MRRSATAVNMGTMKGTWAHCAALAIVTGCGGRQGLLQPSGDATGAAGAAGAAGSTVTIGLVDVTQAPAQVSMNCDSGVGIIAIDNPCLVGHSFGGNPSDAGAHEIECTLATVTHPIVWSFELFIPVTENPVTVLPETPSGVLVDVGGRQARVSRTTGTMTFVRVDPSNRAFVARFDGVITWTEPSGATFSCAVGSSLWGAPGPFT
jgi:hypothetical protein